MTLDPVLAARHAALEAAAAPIEAALVEADRRYLREFRAALHAEARAWAYYGFTADEVKGFIAGGVTLPAYAESLRSYGFTPADLAHLTGTAYLVVSSCNSLDSRAVWPKSRRLIREARKRAADLTARARQSYTLLKSAK